MARFMLSSVSPEHRSDYETELLGEYHRALQSHGISEYSYDEFIHDYRAAHLHNMMFVLCAIPRMTTDFIESDSGQLQLLLIWEAIAGYSRLGLRTLESHGASRHPNYCN